MNNEMKNVLYQFLIFFFAGAYIPTVFATEYGLVIAPVVDAIIKPLGESYDATFYNTLGCYVEKGSLCPYRVHQLIFNELIKIVDEIEHELQVELLNVLYTDKEDNKNYPCRFWCLKKHVMVLSKAAYDQIKDYVPEPLHNKQVDMQKNIREITLKMPWYDARHDICYSVGTRFVRNSIANTEDAYGIYLLNPHAMKVETHYVPAEKIYQSSGNAIEDRRNDFVALLKEWCSGTEEVPYIWGGCSFTNWYQPGFKLGVRGNNEWEWERVKPHDAPYHAGFDCSGIILRAAQIVGLHYSFKNTVTLKTNLRSKSINEPLHEGDLIWYPGHVIIIADLRNNLVIEARGYAEGYGKVHMIPLKEIFKNIDSFEQLSKAYHQKEPLMHLDKRCKVVKEINEFELLKIASC